MNCSHFEYEIVSKQPTAFFWHPEGDIIKVKITHCDFDKYVTMVDEEGNEHHYKWGYVFNTHEDAVLAKDCREEFHLCTRWLKESPNSINPWKLLLSNKNYAKFKKIQRKNKLSETEWFVAVGDESYCTATKFKTFKKALTYFGRLGGKTATFAALGEHSNVGTLCEFEDDVVWILPKDKYSKSPRVIKSRHIGKAKTYKQWRK